ncbi:unnamed protein product [Prorocentrum cordatum]|uniref:Uncharacterized protein n=1 Tax=Prorocentrum cordatum TaxID=2364126 RepID=A0ABN9RIN2_9DINO|nr:unnamed protein product [Polarella glacialis]
MFLEPQLPIYSKRLFRPLWGRAEIQSTQPDRTLNAFLLRVSTCLFRPMGVRVLAVCLPGEAAAWSLGPVAGRGSQPWRPDTASLAETWAEYYGAMERLVALLMSLFAVALGLSCEAFDAALEGHRSSMRAILYHEVSPTATVTNPDVTAAVLQTVRAEVAHLQRQLQENAFALMRRLDDNEDIHFDYCYVAIPQACLDQDMNDQLESIVQHFNWLRTEALGSAAGDRSIAAGDRSEPPLMPSLECLSHAATSLWKGLQGSVGSFVENSYNSFIDIPARDLNSDMKTASPKHHVQYIASAARDCILDWFYSYIPGFWDDHVVQPGTDLPQRPEGSSDEDYMNLGLVPELERLDQRTSERIATLREMRAQNMDTAQKQRYFDMDEALWDTWADLDAHYKQLWYERGATATFWWNNNDITFPAYNQKIVDAQKVDLGWDRRDHRAYQRKWEAQEGCLLEMMPHVSFGLDRFCDVANWYKHPQVIGPGTAKDWGLPHHFDTISKDMCILMQTRGISVINNSAWTQTMDRTKVDGWHCQKTGLLQDTREKSLGPDRNSWITGYMDCTSETSWRERHARLCAAIYAGLYLLDPDLMKNGKGDARHLRLAEEMALNPEAQQWMDNHPMTTAESEDGDTVLQRETVARETSSKTAHCLHYEVLTPQRACYFSGVKKRTDDMDRCKTPRELALIDPDHPNAIVIFNVDPLLRRTMPDNVPENDPRRLINEQDIHVLKYADDLVGSRWFEGAYEWIALPPWRDCPYGTPLPDGYDFGRWEFSKFLNTILRHTSGVTNAYHDRRLNIDFSKTSTFRECAMNCWQRSQQEYYHRKKGKWEYRKTPTNEAVLACWEIERDNGDYIDLADYYCYMAIRMLQYHADGKSRTEVFAPIGSDLNPLTFPFGRILAIRSTGGQSEVHPYSTAHNMGWEELSIHDTPYLWHATELSSVRSITEGSPRSNPGIVKGFDKRDHKHGATRAEVFASAHPFTHSCGQNPYTTIPPYVFHSAKKQCEFQIDHQKCATAGITWSWVTTRFHHRHHGMRRHQWELYLDKIAAEQRETAAPRDTAVEEVSEGVEGLTLDPHDAAAAAAQMATEREAALAKSEAALLSSPTEMPVPTQDQSSPTEIPVPTDFPEESNDDGAAGNRSNGDTAPHVPEHADDDFLKKDDWSPENDVRNEIETMEDNAEKTLTYGPDQTDLPDYFKAFKKVHIVRRSGPQGDVNTKVKQTMEYIVVLNMDDIANTTMTFEFNCDAPWCHRFPEQCGHRAFTKYLFQCIGTFRYRTLAYGRRSWCAMAYLNLYQQAGDKFALIGIENAEIVQNHPGLAALRMGTENYVEDEFVNAAPHDGSSPRNQKASAVLTCASAWLTSSSLRP